jgi:hypothetical protein
VEVRRRTADDLDGCVELLRAIHALDGYPPWLGGGMRDFLDSPDAPVYVGPG